MPLTLKKLLKIKEQMDMSALKPFEGYIGLCKNGFFEIKNQKQFDKLKEATMPLTKKGRRVMKAMRKQYGAKKAKQVFYSSANKGTISGVHK